MRVLVAEDSEINMHLIRSYLRNPLFEIDTAANGAAAMEKFQSASYDLVLMDIQMPVMDGYTATRNIRKWEGEQHRRPTPILALTASAHQEEKQESLDSGCNAHLVKPIHKADLLAAIYKYVAPSDGGPQPGDAQGERIPVKCPADIQEALPLFLESVREDLQAMSQALGSEDFSKLRFIGHDLKGTGGGYGFDPISVIGKSIEQAAKESDAAEIVRQIAALTDYLDRVEVSYE